MDKKLARSFATVKLVQPLSEPKNLDTKKLVQAIYKSLELTPRYIFWKQSINRQDYPRCSGRTTKMLVEALAYYLITGKAVTLIGHNLRYSNQLAKQLSDMFWKIGVDPKDKIKIPNSTPVLSSLKLDQSTFVDHYYYKKR